MGRRLLRALGEAMVSLSRGWRSSVLALAAILSAVFVLGAFLVVSRAVDDAVSRWADAAELSVFLRDDIDEPARSAVDRALRAHPAIRSTRLVSTEEASRRFAKSFPELAPLLGAQGEGPLPASLEARLRRDVDVAEVMTLVARLRRMPGVADVRVDQELLADVTNLARAGRLIGGGLAAILVLAAALAIASVVRLSYVARRDEVDVLYLLGAPLSAIRAPFVAEGALQGAVGTGVGLILLAGAHALVMQSQALVLADLPVGFLPWWLTALLVSGGTLVGAAAGLAAVGAQREDVIQ